jgi:hypothetical protein
MGKIREKKKEKEKKESRRRGEKGLARDLWRFGEVDIERLGKNKNVL